MKTTFKFLLLFATILLVGCKKSPEEIFAEQKSGVVLICNEYYYDITLANGSHIYFTGLDEDGDFNGLTSDLNEVKKNPAILNGTGFFIDQTGRILTNRHVVAPEVDKPTVKRNINAIIGLYAAYIESLQDSMSQRYDAIQNYANGTVSYDEWGNAYTSLSDDDIQMLSQELQNLREQYTYAENVKENVRSNILNDNFSIQLHSQFGIAYDGDNINSWSDFMKKPCNLLRASNDADTDLALLQLRSKATPQDKYIYEIDPDKAYKADDMKINQPLYMIGYNYGVVLAKTNKGINAQFTSGTLTQVPDGNRITYSIPAKQGSSGSPVVDDHGRLVAVNFAGSNGSDNFNFGIPMLRVLTFLK